MIPAINDGHVVDLVVLLVCLGVVVVASADVGGSGFLDIIRRRIKMGGGNDDDYQLHRYFISSFRRRANRCSRRKHLASLSTADLCCESQYWRRGKMKDEGSLVSSSLFLFRGLRTFERNW
jgi:hypothetical protein